MLLGLNETQFGEYNWEKPIRAEGSLHNIKGEVANSSILSSDLASLTSSSLFLVVFITSYLDYDLLNRT